MGYELKMRIWRGDADGGDLGDYTVEVSEGEVVLDAIHRVQATQAGDLAVRWNCKAGKCGSCSAEINGKPRLLCMTRLSDFDPAETITVTPMRTFPVIRDLVTDVSYNYEKARELPSFAPPYQWALSADEFHRATALREGAPTPRSPSSRRRRRLGARLQHGRVCVPDRRRELTMAVVLAAPRARAARLRAKRRDKRNVTNRQSRAVSFEIEPWVEEVAMNEEISEPVIVFGTGRSGTTVFHRILAGHERLAWLATACAHRQFGPEPG